jgi:lipopolysaccharide transport system ATP-binding protein
MSETVIKVENLSKLYQLGEVGTGTISHDLNRFFAKIRGKEDPYQKVGQLNDRTQGAAKGEQVWALKDITFEVKKGEVLGIIGKNGAGKSTLLKLLSRVTAPTTGSIKIKGRVASLLEVGTGFHPEMTGRENIFMNGTILGMTRNDVNGKLEEIVDFAGIAKYLDTPTKRYSSGMTVRLAFAVAAFLEPEILIVDEVLAVGDVEFQKKAIGKMQDISKGEGRTVLVVSHNMTSIQKMCSKGMILDRGVMGVQGAVIDVVDAYLSSEKENSVFEFNIPNNHHEMKGYSETLTIENLKGDELPCIPFGEKWQARVRFRINSPCEHFIIALGINSNYDVAIRTVYSVPMKISNGSYSALFKFDDILLSTGNYKLILGLSNYELSMQYIDQGINVKISDVSVSRDKRVIRNKGVGLIANPIDVEIIEV